MAWRTTSAGVAHTRGSSRRSSPPRAPWKEGSDMSKEQYLDFDQTDAVTGFPLNRRDFLRVTGGGVIVLFAAGDSLLFAQERPGRPMAPNLPSDFNAFLRIGEDGRVSCFTGKIEMGQGVVTSLGQMLADELDVPLESVDMVMGDTDLCPWDMGTFGSLSTRAFGPALRAAGAEARQALVELGAERLQVAADRLATEGGFVYVISDRQRRVSYADLAKGKKITRGVSGKVPVKKPSEFKIMGTAVARRDGKEKVDGSAKFAGDIRVPGMLYAKILRPPAHGAKLVDVDVTEARKVKDVQIVRDGELVAVLHKYPDVAEQALSRIKAKFDTPKPTVDDKTIFDHLLKVAPEGNTVASGGDLKKG